MSTVWFIRHAECEIDVFLPTSTPFTARITAKGTGQAQSIAHVFTRCPDLIITSSYLRSKQTAAPTLQRFPNAHHEEWSVHEFTYLARSVGRKKTTICERRALVEKYWKKLDHHHIDGEGAESFADFMQRVCSTLNLLKNAEEDFIVIFSHGQFILAILSQLMGLNAENMQQFRHFLLANEMPNGAIIKVCLQNTGETWFSPFITSHLI